MLRYFPSGLILGLGGYRTFDFGEPEIWPSLLVEYDDRFGYPTRLDIDWRLGLADDETFWAMRDLAPHR